MNDKQLFYPIQTVDWTSWILLGVTLVFVIAAIYFHRKQGLSKPARQRIMLWQMLCLFGMLLAGSSTFFSFWRTKKIIPVEVSAAGIKTSYGFIKANQLNRMQLKDDFTRSPIRPDIVTDSVYLLILETTDRKAHILSSKNYELAPIMLAISEMK